MNIIDFNETRTTEQVFKSLLQLHEENFPAIAQSLNPPATEKEIERLEKLIGEQLPNEFHELYRLANGQQAVNQPFFHNGYEFMSISDIEANWKMMKELYDSQSGFREEGQAQGPIRDLWWHPKWIPFAFMISGDHYCIDLTPSKHGKSGQIIEFIHDDTYRNHLGFSLTDFLGEYDSGLRSQKYYMHPEWKIIVSDS